MPMRIEQLERSALDENQTRVYDAILKSRGDISGPFRVWLHTPEFADRAQHLGEFVRFNTRLDRRLSELAILVTARSWDCQLEWTLHEPIALDAGIDASVVETIRMGQFPELEKRDERAVYDFTSELLYNRFVQDRTFNAAREELTEAGVVELIGLIGYYGLVALTLTACQLPLPKGVAPGLVDCPTFK